MTIRPARVPDVPAVHSLIQTQAQRGLMILRSLPELYSQLLEFVVCEEEDQIVGCAAAHVFWSDWAEIKCIAVEDAFRSRGYGAALCEALHQNMAQLGVARVFTLTNATGFFEKLGYRKMDKSTLPTFIWGECVRCPSFPECKEDALVKDVV